VLRVTNYIIAMKPVKKNEDMTYMDILLEEDIDDDDIRRIVKKLATYENLDSLDSLVHSIDYSNVIPSNHSIPTCLRKLAAYRKQTVLKNHPMFRMETLLESNHLVFQDTGVIIVKDKEDVAKVEVQDMRIPVEEQKKKRRRRR